MAVKMMVFKNRAMYFNWPFEIGVAYRRESMIRLGRIKVRLSKVSRSFLRTKPRRHCSACSALKISRHLNEEVLSELLVEAASFRDEVEEVLARLRPLHDDDEGVLALEAVQDLDDVRTTEHLPQEANFERNWVAVDLKRGTFFKSRTTTIASLGQGTWLTRPDPRSQIESILNWVPH